VTSTASRQAPVRTVDSSRHSPARILRRKLRRDLRGSRAQAIAVVVTVALGVLLFAASYDAFRNLTASYEQTYDDLAFADLTVTGGAQDAFGTDAEATEGVAAVTQRQQADLPVAVPTSTGDQTLLGRVVGLPAAGQPEVGRVEVLAGGVLGPDQPEGVLVEKHMADHFTLEVGDTLTVLLADGPRELTVLGVVASPEYLWPARDRQEVITTPDEFGVLFAANELVGQAPAGTLVEQSLITYAEGADAAELDKQLAAMARAAGASDVMTQEQQPSNAALDEDLAAFGELSFMFPALFLTGAGLATFIILNRIVAAQRGQIGVLIASGLTRREVLRHYRGYGLVLGIGGALVGIVLGVPLGAWITSTYTQLLSIPDTVVRWYWTTPLIGLAFGLVMGVASAFAPARAAVRVPPALAMRGEVGEVVGQKPSVFERLLPPLRRLPVRTRIALRGIGRHRARSASTVVGVVLAIVLVLTSWGMIDTVNRLMAKQFDVVSTNDAQVFLQVPMDDGQIQTLGQVPGVAAVEPVVVLDATLVTDDDLYATQVQGLAADTVMHGFVGPDGEPVPLPDEGLLVGNATRGVLGVEPGDPLTLSVPSLDASVATAVAGFVDEPLGTYAYAQRDWLVGELEAAGATAAALSSPAVTSAFVQYDAGASPDQVRSELLDESSVVAVVSTTALRDIFDQYLALFYAFVGVMLVLGGILAFALIFNMITAALAERAAELATMRASGLSVTQVNRMITTETLLLTLLGIPLGLLVGYVTAAAFMASFSSDLFSFDLDMNPWTLLWTSLAVLVVALLSQLPGMRAVARLDIATVVRQRSL
jgi:putative ABC transport system permease protein